jgi:O-6-methylguanine DNA methyltransferase
LGRQVIKCEIVESKVGPLQLLELDGSVVALSFDGSLETASKMYSSLDSVVSGVTVHGEILRRYFLGDFSALKGWKIDLNGTPFQLDVWKSLSVIPAGEAWSYKQLAAYIGRPTSIRAVANAVGRNPIAIALPCHRVIATGGGIGGFTGGLWRKISLLEHEGAECVRQMSLL